MISKLLLKYRQWEANRKSMLLERNKSMRHAELRARRIAGFMAWVEEDLERAEDYKALGETALALLAAKEEARTHMGGWPTNAFVPYISERNGIVDQVAAIYQRATELRDKGLR